MRSRRRTRGFTLIELLVAVTAGLFVAIGAFALARQSSRFFQQEARLANAQFSATLGFDRLRADIARAGFLATSNIQRDPFFCGNPALLPSGMASLAAIRILEAKPADAQDSLNSLAPDQLTLSGSYSSAETFPVRTVVEEEGKYNVYLQANTGAIARTDYGGAEGGTLPQIFKAGRVLRILDAGGKYEFGAIESYAVNGSGQMVVSLKRDPAIPFKRAGGTCGVEGLGVGMQANVVNRIRYEIRNVQKNPPEGYKPLYAAGATAPGDESRRELVRVELDSDEAEMADSLEIVAEYAVDLKFGLTVAAGFKTPANLDPELSQFAIGDPKNYEYFAGVGATDRGPHRIRAVRARFAVRSREADRAAGIEAPAGNLFRYQLPGGGFARARTLTADIGLPNLAGVAW
ncbi:MAG TPA: prepilin-type N-terminal cleavage/methylation domain-containing protein [Polyangiaceae bacterium]